jgi:hypothetical protein
MYKKVNFLYTVGEYCIWSSSNEGGPLDSRFFKYIFFEIPNI